MTYLVNEAGKPRKGLKKPPASGKEIRGKSADNIEDDSVQLTESKHCAPKTGKKGGENRA